MYARDKKRKWKETEEKQTANPRVLSTCPALRTRFTKLMVNSSSTVSRHQSIAFPCQQTKAALKWDKNGNVHVWLSIYIKISLYFSSIVIRKESSTIAYSIFSVWNDIFTVNMFLPVFIHEQFGSESHIIFAFQRDTFTHLSLLMVW